MSSVFPGFWSDIPKPVIAMAPMDGVTDFACRAVTARYGKPDVMFTEFTTATGLFYAPERILRDFEYSEIERPIVAQIYGNNPDDFYRATHVVCELGFDGIDINMGCPSKSVTQNNCGGKLITVPELALQIIRATRQAIEDWQGGKTLESSGVPNKVIDVIGRMNQRRTGQERPAQRRVIPYSVKTRLGYDAIIIEKWVEILLQEYPAVISIHGRTLKQMYRGEAHWDAIGRAVQVAKGSGTLLFGNGDVSSLEHAAKVIRESGVDGVLIGRGSMGNPWIFRGKEKLKQALREGLPLAETPPINQAQRFEVALEHARVYQEVRGTDHFHSLRKHLMGYLSHFPDAAVYRSKALQTNNLSELVQVLK